jgi:DNA ligase (NAD+)
MKSKEIINLEEQIKFHQDKYYNGESIISDGEFDALYDTLKTLDPDNPILRKIGADNSNEFSKVKHIMPMGSQHKAANHAEFRKWSRGIVNGGGPLERNCFIVQYKMDGSSIELQYANGTLTKAVTRGDGKTGDDVTNNILKINNIIVHLADKSFSGAVRGEAVMSHKIKEAYFKDKENCRNAANGILKRKDGEGCEYLHIITYDVLRTAGKEFIYEHDKMIWLKENGFDSVPSKEFHDVEDIIRYRDETNILRYSYDYDIDGLVIKCDKINHYDSLRDRPKFQIAFKFNLEGINTVLRDVEWSPSGKYRTPVAICDPVRIAGTTVKRASLANLDLIRALNLKIGDTVVLVKRGEIIPKIESVIKTEPNHINKPIKPPDECEFCGSPLVLEGPYVVCLNKNCPEIIAHRIHKWIKTQDIKYIGYAVIRQLMQTGLVKTIADLYKLTVDDLVINHIFSRDPAVKIYKNIRNAASITLSKFIAGFDIDHVGERLIESLINNGLTTLEEIRNAAIDDLCRISGIDKTLAEYIHNGIVTFRRDMDDVLQYVSIGINTRYNSPISGKSICFSGSFNTMPRKMIERLAMNKGAAVQNKVTSSTLFLVTNDTGSTHSKIVTAKQNGIPILSECEFIDFLNRQ